MNIGDQLKLEGDILLRIRWLIKKGEIPWSVGRTKAAAVMDLMRFGSTTSEEICRWADCDPYEVRLKKGKIK